MTKPENYHTPTLAPIALFVYNRPVHTARTIEALMKNELAAESELFIFSDGSKSEHDLTDVDHVRSIIRNVKGFKKVVITERRENMGLANSIIDGVTQLCSKYKRVIVLEDDLVVSKHFLSYMNTALDRYEDDAQVMQISGYMFPVEIKTKFDAVFLPFITSWGWATWQRAWAHFDPDMSGYEKLSNNPALRRKFDLDEAYPYFNMLEAQRDGKIDSWAIRWYLSVFIKKGLTLFPVRTLVDNIGFDGSGTHCGNRTVHVQEIFDFKVVKFPKQVKEMNNEKKHIFKYLYFIDRKMNFLNSFLFELKNCIWG